MDPTLRLLKALIGIDSVNPSLVHGAAGEAEVARAIANECRGHRTRDSPPGSRSRPAERDRRAQRPRAGTFADVLRPYRHRRRRRHDAPLRSGRTRRTDLRPRIAGHEGRRGRDDRRGPGDCRIRRTGRRPHHRGVCRRRRARQHWRRCPGDVLARRRRRGDRADGTAGCRRPQGFRVGGGGDGGSRGARQPPARRPRCDHADGARARRRSSRSIANCRPAARTRWSAPRRCTRRSSKAAAN